MNKLGEWIHSHPYLTGLLVIVGGLILYELSKTGGSSSGGSAIGQIAQAQTAQQVASLQAQAQAYSVQAQAQAQVAAQQAQLQAAQDQYQAQENIVTTQTAGQVAGEGIQAQVYKDLIDAGLQETQSNNALAGQALNDQYSAVNNAIELTKMGNRGNIGANELALILGQGNISSFNQGTAADSVANSMMLASLFKGLSNVGTAALG